MPVHATIEHAIASLPTAPAGFDWDAFKDAVFLKPSLWKPTVAATTTAAIPTFVMSATEGDVDSDDSTQPKLAVSIFSQPKRCGGVSASRMALMHLHPHLQNCPIGDVILLEQEHQQNVEVISFRFHHKPAGQPAQVIHKYLVASDVADALHAFTFQSPLELWDSAWEQYGKTFLDHARVLPNLAMH